MKETREIWLKRTRGREELGDRRDGREKEIRGGGGIGKKTDGGCRRRDWGA